MSRSVSRHPSAVMAARTSGLNDRCRAWPPGSGGGRCSRERSRMKAASISITAGWSAGESRAIRSSAWMPPMRTSTFSQPSCSRAFAYRSVTRPSRDSANLRTVNNSAPVASSPAPSASTRPRAVSQAIRESGPLAGPPSWCASQSPVGTSTTRAAAGASPMAATPPSVHRMPRCEAAHRFITCKTLGD